MPKSATPIVARIPPNKSKDNKRRTWCIFFRIRNVPKNHCIAAVGAVHQTCKEIKYVRLAINREIEQLLTRARQVIPAFI